MKKIIYILIVIAAIILITGAFKDSPSSDKKDKPNVSESTQLDDDIILAPETPDDTIGPDTDTDENEGNPSTDITGGAGFGGHCDIHNIAYSASSSSGEPCPICDKVCSHNTYNVVDCDMVEGNYPYLWTINVYCDICNLNETLNVNVSKCANLSPCSHDVVFPG